MAATRYQNARWFIAGLSVAALVGGTAYFLDEPYATAAEQPAVATVAPAPASSTNNDNRVTTTTRTTTKKSRGS